MSTKTVYVSADQDNMYYLQHIVLDKQTAIRLVKDIKRQISYLKDEVSND